jgi:general secretion pathway protein G
MRNMHRGQKAHRTDAFTLIELLLVMVILVILAAVVVPKFASRGEQARQAAARTDISNLETALDTFEVDNGRYPSNEEGLASLVNAPSGLTNWHGPYFKANATIPIDPWNSPYIYQFPGQHNPNGFDLYSYGPDKREGNDDIVNWMSN